MKETIRNKKCKISYLEPSQFVRRKSKSQRKRNRSLSIAQHFGKHTVWTYIHDLKFFQFDNNQQQIVELKIENSETIISQLQDKICSLHFHPNRLRDHIHHFVIIEDIHLESHQIQLRLPSHINEKEFNKVKVKYLLVGNVSTD